MPATAFDATAHRLSSLAVQTLVALDSSVLTELQGEDFLLIQSCLRAGTSERLQEVDEDGELVLDIHFNQKLTYAISARVLEFDGLADYHPGRSLDDRLLAFANGRRALQFTNTGKLIYLDPRQTLSAGDLPSIDFTVEHIFIDLDETTYPSTYVVTYYDLSAQASQRPAWEGIEAMQSDIFQGTSLCAGALTATLYDGDPATTGTPLGIATSAAWTTAGEAPGDDDNGIIESPLITWEGAGAERSITHIRISRPGLTVFDIALGATVTLPAWQYLRASVSDLVADLTWPWSGDSVTARPAPLGLRYLFGDTVSGLTTTETTLTVKCYDDDPDTTGTLLDTFTVPRDAATWDCTGIQVENLAALVGTNLNPGPGDWVTSYVTVEMAGLATLLVKQALSGDITTVSGDAITIPAGALAVTFS